MLSSVIRKPAWRWVNQKWPYRVEPSSPVISPIYSWFSPILPKVGIFPRAMLDYRWVHRYHPLSMAWRGARAQVHRKWCGADYQACVMWPYGCFTIWESNMAMEHIISHYIISYHISFIDVLSLSKPPMDGWHNISLIDVFPHLNFQWMDEYGWYSLIFHLIAAEFSCNSLMMRPWPPQAAAQLVVFIVPCRTPDSHEKVIWFKNNICMFYKDIYIYNYNIIIIIYIYIYNVYPRVIYIYICIQYT